MEIGKAKAVILDLRGAGGADWALLGKMGELFLPRGTAVTVTHTRGGPDTVLSTQQEGLPNVPVIVLVNGVTSQFAELLAAALQDHKRARVVATRTYGSVSSATPVSLPKNALLKLAGLEYRRAAGGHIHGVGVTPDLVIEQPLHEAFSKDDKVLAAGLSELRLALQEGDLGRKGASLISPPESKSAKREGTPWSGLVGLAGIAGLAVLVLRMRDSRTN